MIEIDGEVWFCFCSVSSFFQIILEKKSKNVWRNITQQFFKSAVVFFFDFVFVLSSFFQIILEKKTKSKQFWQNIIILSNF